MKKYLVTLLVALIFATADAQESVTFEFSDGIEQSALKTKMEKQVGALLTAINRAAANGDRKSVV